MTVSPYTKQFAEQLREKARRQGLSIGLTVSHEAIVRFEEENSVQLPEAYRAFLLYVGNGNEGPYGSCLNYFYDPFRTTQPMTAPVHFVRESIQNPFPFTSQWIWESEPPPPEGGHDEVMNGHICVAESGCGIEWRLIVAGPEVGNIWYFCEMGMSPVSPRRNFLEWYDGCLDGKPWTDESPAPAK